MASIFEENFIYRESFTDVTVGDILLGYSFAMYLPDPRGTHLSCLEDFILREDGVEVPGDRMILCLNQKELLVSHFPDLSYEYWQIGQDARMKVYSGKSYQSLSSVEVSYQLRVPYAGDWEHRELTPRYAKQIFRGEE